MSEAILPVQAKAELPLSEIKKKTALNTLTRVGRYMLVRLVVLFLTVVVGVYLTILIANMGGFVDKIKRGEIEENIGMQLGTDKVFKTLSADEKETYRQQLIDIQIKRQGLDKPFLWRSINYLSDALTLNMGRALQMTSDSGSKTVRLIMLERLPTTLVLFGTTGLILFFVEMFISLSLSRKYGSFWDKFFVTTSPLSSTPGWFYGIFLILIFAAVLKVLPFGGMVDAPPPTNKLEYALSMLKHMALPAIAITLSQIFFSVYSWRTFFLIYSSEDYVDVAKAKGLSSRAIERRYILRPTLPYIVTSFALFLIYSWTGAPIFETVFQWPGLGRILITAVGFYDIPVIVGSTVIFAYLLVLTVFLLEFVYALVDPRVKVGGSGGHT